MIRRFMEKGIAEFGKERAAVLRVEGKTSISGAAEMADLTIPEMVQLLAFKGHRLSYSLEDFRKGERSLQKMVKPEQAVGLWPRCNMPRSERFIRTRSTFALLFSIELMIDVS